MENQPNWESLLRQAILQVFSAPLFLIQLILSYLNWWLQETNQINPNLWEEKLERSTQKSDLRDYGLA